MKGGDNLDTCIGLFPLLGGGGGVAGQKICFHQFAFYFVNFFNFLFFFMCGENKLVLHYLLNKLFKGGGKKT